MTIRRIGEVLADERSSLQEMVIGRERGSSVPTGFRDLDQITGGLAPGTLVAVAAEPGVGKSTFALGVAWQVARTGRRATVVSPEMSAVELARRVWAAASRVDTGQLRLASLRGEEWTQTLAPFEDLRAAPLFLHDGEVNADDLTGATTPSWLTDPTVLLVVDCLDLLRVGVRDPDGPKDLGGLARRLRRHAREWERTVLATVRLPGRRALGGAAAPDVYDLRSVGLAEVKQEADVVLALHREELLTWTARIARCSKRRSPTSSGSSSRLRSPRFSSTRSGHRFRQEREDAQGGGRAVEESGRRGGLQGGGADRGLCARRRRTEQHVVRVIRGDPDMAGAAGAGFAKPAPPGAQGAMPSG